MKAYECKGKVSKDGHLDIPLDIKKELKENQEVRLIILTENNKEENNVVKELRGAYKGELSSSKEFSKQKKLEKDREDRNSSLE